jgi:hypothetical protein
MEVINSLAAYFFRAQELLVECGRSPEEDCIWML